MERKTFLNTLLMGMSVPYFPSGANNGSKPIVVSTWDSGMAVNAEVWKVLDLGGSGLDAVEAGAIHIENTIDCCVGLGGYPDRDGIVTLDACIMDGDGDCGAVAALEKIKHPVSVARKIMETTPHVMLAGEGAQQFAIANGFKKESGELSVPAENAWKNWLKNSEYKPQINIEKKGNGPFAPPYFNDGSPNHDTMGILALDKSGKMAGAVTTSGMAFKLHGRVGDSPVIGAGLFVDNEAGAATSSGVGEEVIRICGTHLVVELLRQGYSPEAACKKAVERIIRTNRKRAELVQVGFLALDKRGNYGSYAIQKGFVFSVRSNNENKIIESKYII